MMVAENTQIIAGCRFCHSQNMVPANCATFECYRCRQRQEREQQAPIAPPQEVADSGGGLLSGLKSGWRKAKQGIKEAVGADVGKSPADEERQREADLQAREEAELEKAIQASLADLCPPQFSSSSSFHDTYPPSYITSTVPPIAHTAPSQHSTAYPSVGPPPAFATEHPPPPNVPRTSTESSSYMSSSYMAQTDSSRDSQNEFQVSQAPKKQYDSSLYNTNFKGGDSGGGGPPLYNASAYSSACVGGGYGGHPPSNEVVIASGSTPAVTAAVCQQCQVLQNWLADGDKQNERLREQLQQAQLDLTEQKGIVEKLKSEVRELEVRATQPVQQAQTEESVVEQLLQRIEELEAQLMCATNFAQPPSESEHETVARARISPASAAQQSSNARLINFPAQQPYPSPSDIAPVNLPAPVVVVAGQPLAHNTNLPSTQGTPSIVVAEGISATARHADTSMVVIEGTPYMAELPRPPPPVTAIIATPAVVQCAENVLGGAATALTTSTTGTIVENPAILGGGNTSDTPPKTLEEGPSAADTVKDGSSRVDGTVENATVTATSFSGDMPLRVVTDGVIDLPRIIVPLQVFSSDGSTPGSSVKSATPMTGEFSCMRSASDIPVPTITIAGEPRSQMVYSTAGDTSPSSVPISVVTVSGVLPQANTDRARLLANPSLNAVASMATGSTCDAGDTGTYGSPRTDRPESGDGTLAPLEQNMDENCTAEVEKDGIFEGTVEEETLHKAEDETLDHAAAKNARLAEQDEKVPKKEEVEGKELNDAELKGEKPESVEPKVEQLKDEGSKDENPTGVEPKVEKLKDENPTGMQPVVEESKDVGPKDAKLNSTEPNGVEAKVEELKDEGPKDAKLNSVEPNGVEAKVEESKDEGPKDAKLNGVEPKVEESKDEGPKGADAKNAEPKNEETKNVERKDGKLQRSEASEEEIKPKCVQSSENGAPDAEATDTRWAAKVRNNEGNMVSESDKESDDEDKERLALVSASIQNAGGSADDKMSSTVYYDMAEEDCE